MPESGGAVDPFPELSWAARFTNNEGRLPQGVSSGDPVEVSTRKSLLFALVIIPLVVFGLIFGALYAVAEVNSRPFQWRIVAQDERREAHGRVMTFGYRIEKSCYGAEAYRLTIYGDTFSHFFIAKPVDLVRIVKQDWLCQDRVLYLHLETKYVDSGFPPVTPLKILYDFETLELSMLRQNGEWSPRPREYRLARTITEAESTVVSMLPQTRVRNSPTPRAHDSGECLQHRRSK